MNILSVKFLKLLNVPIAVKAKIDWRNSLRSIVIYALGWIGAFLYLPHAMKTAIAPKIKLIPNAWYSALDIWYIKANTIIIKRPKAANGVKIGLMRNKAGSKSPIPPSNSEIPMNLTMPAEKSFTQVIDWLSSSMGYKESYMPFDVHLWNHRMAKGSHGHSPQYLAGPCLSEPCYTVTSFSPVLTALTYRLAGWLWSHQSTQRSQ